MLIPFRILARFLRRKKLATKSKNARAPVGHGDDDATPAFREATTTVFGETNDAPPSLPKSGLKKGAPPTVKRPVTAHRNEEWERLRLEVQESYRAMKKRRAGPESIV